MHSLSEEATTVLILFRAILLLLVMFIVDVLMVLIRIRVGSCCPARIKQSITENGNDIK